MTPRRAIAGLAGALLAVAWVVALTRLWPSTVPAGLKLPHVPDTDVLTGEALDRARRYSRGAALLELVRQLVVLAVLWVYARRGLRLMRESAAGPVGTGIMLGMLGLALVWLASLPLRFAEFWWTKHYGMLRTDWFTFVVGDYFELGAQFVAASLQLAVVMGLARLLRRGWPYVAVPVVVAIQLGLVLAYPLLLSDLEPVDNPGIRADAARLAERQGVRDVTLRVMEVHEETPAPNAEAIGGLGDGGHVILWDTLLRNGFTRPEIDAVVGHEIAHLGHHDTLRSLGFMGLMLLALAVLAERLTRRRGGLGRPEAVPVALLVVVAFTFATQPLEAAFSRDVEAAADWAVLDATRDPAAARAMFRRLGKVALAEPSSPWWSHVLYDSHPPFAQRVAMTDAWAQRHGATR